MHYIGFDIGGSKVKSVLVKNRKILISDSEKLPHNFTGLINLIAKKTRFFSSKTGKGKISGVGFSFPGPLDIKREKVLSSPNIKYLNRKSLKKVLIQRLKYPIKFEHDVHSFLLAEKKVGVAKNLKNVFYLTLGTGIGGAFMINGEVVRGFHGSAGEVGHMIIEVTKWWDFEKLGSNKFVRRVSGKDASEIYKLADSGDKKAKKVLGLLGHNLGIGLANIVNIFDPEAIILSGGLSGARKFIESNIKAEIKKFVISPEARKTKILFSRLGYFGGALGATLLFDKS